MKLHKKVIFIIQIRTEMASLASFRFLARAVSCPSLTKNLTKCRNATTILVQQQGSSYVIQDTSFTNQQRRSFRY